MTEPGPVGIDPEVIERWLPELGITFAEPLSFHRIGLGQSNLTYRICDNDGRSWVLRRPPLGTLLASAHDVAREARILSALAATSVPIPRVYGLTRNHDNVPLLLMKFIDGVVVDSVAVAKTLNPQHRRHIGLALPSVLAKIHAVDIDAVGLTDLGSHKPYAQRQLKRWTGQWELCRTRNFPELNELTRRLTASAPEQQELRLVHGDFHLRNLITSHDTGAVTAVLDWELSTLGDPLADMGSLLAYWPAPGEDTAGDFAAAALEGFPDRAELSRVYLAETGRDEAMLKYWHAFGLWKLAIIAEGVMRRAMDEPKNKAAAGTPTVDTIDELVFRAVKVADEAGI